MSTEHPQPQPQYMTPVEVARLLRVDTSTLRRWAKAPVEKRRLNPTYTQGGHARYLASEVYEVLREKAEDQVEETDKED